jgi:uncharacterized protein (TIGR03546 family)
MLLLKLLINFIQVLNEKASPRAIAGGAALGAVIGLTPTGSLHNALILFLIFLLPVNKSAALFAAAVLSLPALLLAPLFNAVGRFLLVDARALAGFWEILYNTPVLPWTKFNNTLTLGSLVVALVLFFPIFYLSERGVLRYRDVVLAKARQWKVFQLIKASKYYALIEKFS